MSIPQLVVRDIEEAVSSAIQFGVSVIEFKRIAAELWDTQLQQKRVWDAKEFAK